VAFWFIVMEVEVATSSALRGPWLANAAAVAAMALAAAWRRRYPLFFLLVVGALAAALSAGLTSLDRSTITGLYTLVVPLFTVAAWTTRGRATSGLAMWTAGAIALATVHNTAAGGLAGAVVMGVVVWSTGLVWRAQLLLHAELTETTAQLAAERDHRARLAVTTERTRIARDLHGPVARGVTTMVVQAEAARQLLLHQPEQVEAAVGAIEQTGREALTQLRRILGVLRSTTGPSSTALTAAETPSAADAGERSPLLLAAVLT
jgi:signal transduction histidine kinase